MLKRIAPFLMVLMAAGVAYAQPGGGGHGRGGRGGAPPGRSRPPASASSAPGTALKPVNQLEIVGVVKAIDAKAERITIAYDAVEALNWPPGTMPFPVAKAALLASATVGEKVRFSVDGGQISMLKPFDSQ